MEFSDCDQDPAPCGSDLIGWTVGFVVGYWLPPRPTISFVRWTSERIGMIAVFYALVLKTPPLVAPSLNAYVAHGIAFVLFVRFISRGRDIPRAR